MQHPPVVLMLFLSYDYLITCCDHDMTSMTNVTSFVTLSCDSNNLKEKKRKRKEI